jgi:putative transposase
MAKLPRLNLAGIPQHVVQRGNNRQVSFFAEQDYAVYLDKLKDYAKKISSKCPRIRIDEQPCASTHVT